MRAASLALAAAVHTTVAHLVAHTVTHTFAHAVADTHARMRRGKGCAAPPGLGTRESA